jgi:hypothetical protein
MGAGLMSKEAAPTTIEALMYELREDGVAAMRVPNCRRRLGDLSPQQVKEVLSRLLALRPRYPKITDELIERIDGLRR